VNGVNMQNDGGQCLFDPCLIGEIASRCCKSRARSARWQLDQQRAERAVGLPQPQPARQAGQQHWLSVCIELTLAGVDALVGQQNQMPFSGARALLPASKVKGTQGVGRAAAAFRQLLGLPLDGGGV
jgi:hypothetical protein